jgi:hypothetical protein
MAHPECAGSGKGRCTRRTSFVPRSGPNVNKKVKFNCRDGRADCKGDVHDRGLLERAVDWFKGL